MAVTLGFQPNLAQIKRNSIFLLINKPNRNIHIAVTTMDSLKATVFLGDQERLYRRFLIKFYGANSRYRSFHTMNFPHPDLFLPEKVCMRNDFFERVILKKSVRVRGIRSC